MKKGPNFRWSLIQCSGGDEGDRTPDLLTASQALSQLSYAPVRKSTIRELPRRCKCIFGKTFAGAGPGRPFGPEVPAGRAPRAGGGSAARLSGALTRSRDPPSTVSRLRGAARHAPGGRSAGDGPIIGPGRASAHPATSKPCRITGPGREPPSTPESVETKPQVEGLHIPLNAGYGRPVWVQPRNPA